MCLTPITIKNTNKGSKHFSVLRDNVSEYIRVPCGHCGQCIAMRQMDIVQRTQMEALENHLYFCTLTYQDSKLPKLETEQNYIFKYARYEDIRDVLQRIRKGNKFGVPFRYFYVSERGHKFGRPHFHIMFSIKKADIGEDFLAGYAMRDTIFNVLLSEWKRNMGTRNNPLYTDLCRYVEKWEYLGGGLRRLRRTFDAQYVNPGTADDVGFYVLKYMLKDINGNIGERTRQAIKINYSETEYRQIWKTIRNRYDSTPNWGCSKKAKEYIQKCIVESYMSGAEMPYFINPNTGQHFPLSDYYKKRYWNKPYTKLFEENAKNRMKTDKLNVYDKTPEQVKKDLADYRKRNEIVNGAPTWIELEKL